MIWLIISVLIVSADQLTKYFMAKMELHKTVFSIFNLFDIEKVTPNKGGAWSMLDGHVVLLSAISVVFCVAVAVYWIKKKPKHPLLCTALTLLFSGALGNAIDRIVRGEVIDFIVTKFINFPVFNIADIAITVGAGLFILYIILFDREDKNGSNNS